jgi:hypothetical protein
MTTAVHGEWLAVDAVAIEFTDRLVAQGVDRPLAVRYTRECFPAWFAALQAAEWGNLAASYCAVGWARFVATELADKLAKENAELRPDDPLLRAGIDTDPVVLALRNPLDTPFFASGSLRKIETDSTERVQDPNLGRGVVSPLVIVSMALVLTEVRRRADQAGIGLRRFTAEPGSADEAALSAEIADYKRRSQERLRRKGSRRRTPRQAAAKAQTP